MKRSETACHRRRRWPSAPLPLPLPLLFLLSLSAPLALAGLPGASLVSGARRRLNLGSMFGSSTAAPSYERIAGQPCFTVTTAWGSPYLIFERVPEDEAGAAADDDDEPADFGAAAAPRQDARQVVLYFMDPDDAECHRDEMQQIDAMKGADMRVMVMSLGKAVRQASNVGKGLPTGQPIDPLTGAMKSPDEGGVLRYKIVPPKRELYYAARCKGRERVGLFDESADFDAKMMLNSRKTLGQYAEARRNARLEREKAGKKVPAAAMTDPNAPDRLKYAHMEGNVGIPVFSCPGLVRRHPVLKRLVNRKAQKTETPLFFSYEDLEEAWRASRASAGDAARASMPASPPDVEVHSLVDVVTSIDKDQWRVARSRQLRREQVVDSVLSRVPIVGRLLQGDVVPSRDGTEGGSQPSGLEQVTFVPSSRTVGYKERVSSLGGSKSRLKPMRPWGKNM